MSKGESSQQFEKHILNTHQHQSRITGPQQQFNEILNEESVRLNNITIENRQQLPVEFRPLMQYKEIPSFNEMETIFTHSQQQLQHPQQESSSEWAREFSQNSIHSQILRPNFNMPMMSGISNMQLLSQPIIPNPQSKLTEHANQKWQQEFEKQIMQSEQKTEAVDTRDWESEFQDIWNNLKLDQDNEFFEDFKLTVQDYNTPYEFEPQNPYLEHENPYLLGLEMIQNNESLTLVALAFEASLQKDSSNSDCWLQLGKIQAENEKEPAAILALKKSIELNPLSLECLQSLAISYINEGLTNEALQSLNTWLQLSFPGLECPTFDHDLHENLVDYYLKAVKLNSTEKINADLQLNLGLLFYNSGDYQKTIDCFTCALSTRTQDYLLWNRLGATLSNSNSSLNINR